MANWANPTITSNYITFVDEVKARDVDAITLQAVAVTNPPVSSIRLLRAPTKFQEWNGTTWIDKILSPEGGGTGSNSLAGISGQLGLGTMAYQNANNINVSGGSLSNVGLVSPTLTGAANYTGNGMTFYSQAGSVPVYIVGGAGQWGMSIQSPDYGLVIFAGAAKSTTGFLVKNAAQNITGLSVRGDMCVECPMGLTIPVGANRYVPV